MYKLPPFLLICLLLFISACDNNRPTEKKIVAKKTFNLAHVKTQYADVALSIADISEQSYQKGSALAITFSTPLDPKKDIQSFLKVSDKKGLAVKGHWIISDNGLTAYFPDVEPNSNYVVDVFKDLSSATEKKLAQSVSQSVTTRKMTPQVSFASQGSILPAKLSKGLPIISVNIDEVDINFHRIKTDKISHFIHAWAGSNRQSNYELRDYAAYTDLVYSGRFTINPTKNTRYTTHLDLNAIEPLNQQGIYLAVMNPAGAYNDKQQVTFFTVSDIGLHARFYPNKLSIQLSSLATGLALPDVSLRIIDAKENVLAKTSSDPSGQGVFTSLSNKARLVIAQSNNQIALLRLNGPALDLSEFKSSGRPYRALEIFTYGPRDLYRPGETVKINALLRDADGQAINAPPLNAVLKRPDGQKIKFFTLYPDKSAKKQGFYHTEYTLPSHALTGQWTLELSINKQKTYQYSFQVEAFLPERMELLLGEQNTETHWTNATDALKIPVSGQYLYGAPAAKNKLSSKVIITPNRQAIASLSDYFFGLADEKPTVDFFETESIKLDEKGLTTLTIPSRWKDIKNTPLNIKVITSLFETGGRPVTRSINYHSWPQPALLGIRPQSKLDNISADSQINFDVIKANVNGELQGDTNVLATLIRERRDYYWEYSDGRGWHYNHSRKNITAFKQRLTLNNQQPSVITLPVDWGWYLLTVKDLKTGQLSSLRFQAGNGWRDQANADAAQPDRVTLTLDKKSYQADQTARINIIPPYQGEGFVMVESGDDSLWFQRVTVPAEGLTLSIPINKNWARHDLYISAVIFRSGDSQEKITPNRAVGLIHLPLNREDRHLSVALITPPAPIRPEKTLTTTVKIKGLNNQSSAYITLAAVDVGVLNITDFKTPNPHHWFFQARRYAVDQRDVYNKIIELTDGGLVKPRFGGDADNAAGGAKPNSSVKIVALTSALVAVDNNGEASIDLELPNFNGRLRLMAVAFNDNQFGSAETDITVAAPIIAEASLPRFLAAGDTSTLTLDVRNQSGKPQTLSLALSATSPIALNSDKLSFTLNDKEKQVYHFPLSAALAFGQSILHLSLHNSDQSIQINRHWQLGVRPAYPAVNTIEQKMITAGESITLNPALKGLLLSSANSQLIVSPQPPINTKQHLQSLFHYPYGCLEQTISSTYPWLSLTEENLKKLKLDTIKIDNNPINIANKPTQIEKGISRLAGMQRNNGGFGLWSNHSQEEHWLTTYAANFLLDARDKNIIVPDALLNKTLIRLTQYLNHRGHMYDERYSQAPSHYSFAYKAYAAYVLSRVNRAPLSALRTLFDHHRKSAKSALPLTHLGLALYKQGDKKRGLQAITESLNKPRNNLLYLSDYGSRLRDMSMMIYLFSQHPVPVAKSKLLIYPLAAELSNRHYLSTQERNALFQASLALTSDDKTRWQGALILDNTTLKLHQTLPYKEQFWGDDMPRRIQFMLDPATQTPLYLQYSLSAYPTIAPKMQMDTIIMERNYYDLKGKPITAQHHKTGDVLLVHLNVRANKRIADALVVELLPAGFELENQHLSNSITIDGFKIEGKTIKQLQSGNRVNYQEYLDDRFVAALDLHKNRTQHLFYLMRAVTTGKYTNPPPYAEDMYRPYIQAIGRSFPTIEIIK